MPNILYIKRSRKVRRYQRGNQNQYIEEGQTIQWLKCKRTNNNIQNTTRKLKDRSNTNQLKQEMNADAPDV